MWHRININENHVKAWTDRAALIQLPHSSHLSGFAFWHPSKLVRESGRQYSISYTEEFVFRLKKYGRGKYNSREIIEQREVGPGDIVGAFSDAYGYEPLEPEIYTPAYLAPEGAVADESLIDYE